MLKRQASEHTYNASGITSACLLDSYIGRHVCHLILTCCFAIDVLKNIAAMLSMNEDGVGVNDAVLELRLKLGLPMLGKSKGGCASKLELMRGPPLQR